MSTNTDVKDIISLIQDLDISTSFNIFVPSLKTEIPFKQLTTEQLKRLLKTIIDSPIYSSEFTQTVNAIIKENCINQEIQTDNFSVFDKLIILFKLRIESISSNYTFIFSDDEIKNNNLLEKSKIFSLSEHLENFLKLNINFEEQTFTYTDCTIVCNLPTLSTENKLERELHKNIKIDVNTPEELRSIVGETFINEITKFISSITIKETSINLLTLPFKDRIKIIENLPTTVINDVIKYIENYRKITKNLTSCNLNVETGQQSFIVIEKEIPQDATFFNM